jgi:hypothetical protein
MKPGPYRPNEFADWAPQEGAADAGRMVEWLTDANFGTRWLGMTG